MRNTSDKSGVATVHAVMLGTFMSGMDINVVNITFQSCKIHFTRRFLQLLLLPMSFSVIVAAPISGAISDQFDSRILSSVGLALMGTGIVLFSFYNQTTPVPFIILSMARGHIEPAKY